MAIPCRVVGQQLAVVCCSCLRRRQWDRGRESEREERVERVSEEEKTQLKPFSCCWIPHPQRLWQCGHDVFLSRLAWFKFYFSWNKTKLICAYFLSAQTKYEASVAAAAVAGHLLKGETSWQPVGKWKPFWPILGIIKKYQVKRKFHKTKTICQN